MEVNDGRLIGDHRPQFFKKNFPVTQLVTGMTAISFIWVLLYKFWFLKEKEFFLGASAVGEIFYNVFLSVIASSVFYFIVVYLPELRKKKVVNRVVSKRIGKLNLDYILIKHDLYKLKNQPVPDELPTDFNEIVKLCEGILLTDKPPHIHNNPPFYPANWFEYFEYYFGLEKHNIEHLNRYWDDVPSEVKVLMDELESNTLKSGLQTYKTTNHSNKLSDLGGPIWTHLNTLNRIVFTFQKEWKS